MRRLLLMVLLLVVVGTVPLTFTGCPKPKATVVDQPEEREPLSVPAEKGGKQGKGGQQAPAGATGGDEGESESPTDE